MMNHQPMTVRERTYQEALCALLEEAAPCSLPAGEYLERCVADAGRLNLALPRINLHRDDYQRHHSDRLRAVRLCARINGTMFVVELDEQLVRIYNPRWLMQHNESFTVDLADPALPELAWDYMTRMSSWRPEP